ncbi:MAG: methyl-accepting chemotaxis protein [Methylacidiphilales bacterium]|nr:methyl-accepting chemotaxis protein [Candidatus Methylacidiphilales bacterium]
MWINTIHSEIRDILVSIRDVFLRINRIYIISILVLLAASYSSIYLSTLRSKYEAQILELQKIEFDSERLQQYINFGIFNNTIPLITYENLMQNIIIQVQNIVFGSDKVIKVESRLIPLFKDAGINWHRSLLVLVKRFNHLAQIRKTNQKLNNILTVIIPFITTQQENNAKSLQFSNTLSSLLLISKLQTDLLGSNVANTSTILNIDADIELNTKRLVKITNSITLFLKTPEYKLSSAAFDELVNSGEISIPELATTPTLLLLLQELSTEIKNLQLLLTDVYQVNQSVIDSKIYFQEYKNVFTNIQQATSGKNDLIKLFFLLSYLLWVMVALFAILSYYVYVNELKQRNEQVKKENDLLTYSVLNLITEISDYASGDLSRDVTVTSSMTGSIADSVNLVIQSMRTIIKDIQTNSKLVLDFTNQNTQLSSFMQNLTVKQISLIEKINQYMVGLSDEFFNVAEIAREVEKSATESKNINIESVSIIIESVNSIDFIRTDIQNTSRRLKHLGESTQKIGDIVSILTNIAKQTKLVALNASIQISSDSVSGYGMLGVVEETKKLANLVEDSAGQTAEIVNSIQRETAKTIESMELFTSKVVAEYEKTKQAKQSLDVISSTYNELLSNINNVVIRIIENSEKMQKLSTDVFNVSDLSKEISASIEKTDIVSSNLSNTVSTLVSSVSIFNLPKDTALKEVDPTDPRASSS